MKCVGVLLILFSAVFSGLADEDAFAGQGNILSIREMSGDDRSGRAVEMLKINTSQHGADFSGTIRLLLELTDKNRTVYFGEITASAPAHKLRANGTSPTGSVAWEFSIDSAGMKHPKFTGYSVEFLWEESGQSVLLDSECEDCGSAEELAARNKNSQKIKIRKKVKVDYPNVN